jgi:hypothetical protein
MTTTRIPGFSAEASLYRSGAPYYAQATSKPRRSNKGIIHPAMRTFCVQSGEINATMCCWVWDGGHYCWFKDTYSF